MPITNPSPIVAAGAFSSLWAAAVHVDFTTDILRATLLPYDGTYLLASGKVRVMKGLVAMREDVASAAALDALRAEAARQAGCQPAEVQQVTVRAIDPTIPVLAVIRFAGGTHQIADCFALAATDQVFGGVLQGTLNEIARHV